MAAHAQLDASRGHHTGRLRSAGQVFGLIKEAWTSFTGHNAYRYAAALAFYTAVSLAPLVVIGVGVLSLVFGAESARAQLIGQIEGLVGEEGAGAIKTVLENADRSSGIIATVLGVIAFIVGYIAVYSELQAGLNTMWDVPAASNASIWVTIRKFLLSFGMLAVFGFLLMVSLLVSSVLSSFNEALNAWQPGLVVLWQVVNIVVAFGVAFLLFAIIFKYIPDVRIAWSDVWVGAAITAVLFMIGKVVIGLYLGNSGVASSYGAAGSLVVLLLWVYYSTLILFFGAELTQAWANRFGSRIKAVPQPT